MHQEVEEEIEEKANKCVELCATKSMACGTGEKLNERHEYINKVSFYDIFVIFHTFLQF